MEIKVLYHSSEIKKLEYIGGKSDWIDLRAAEEKVLKKGEYALISLGISVKLPEGYEAHIVPRSSTFRNWGILQTNSVGIIDNSYSSAKDVWMMPVFATRDAVIHVNDRICQFRIFRNQPELTFAEASVQEMDATERGGFGSTGTH